MTIKSFLVGVGVDTYGDPNKRTCEYYAECSNFKTDTEAETGAQLRCAVCGAACWVPIEEMQGD